MKEMWKVEVVVCSSRITREKKNIYLGILLIFPCNTVVQLLATCTFGFASLEMPAKHTNRTDKALKGHSAVSFVLKTHVKSRKHFYLSGSNLLLFTVTH